MKLITSAQMRELDQKTITECNVPGETLMDRAGLGVARAIEYLADISGYANAPVGIFAGRGNNGGDAFVVARYLREWGAEVYVWMTGEAKAVRGDARTHLARLTRSGVRVNELTTPDDFDALGESGLDCGIIVDGILGTGSTGPARGVAAAAIRCINAFGQNVPVVAIDIPSGLNADTGEAPGETVRADLTVTMGYPKIGLASARALDFVGSVDVVDIGIPDFLAERIESSSDLITAGDVYPLFRRRDRRSHKGSYGHIQLIGGAPGYAGAMGLAAGAALRSGAGLVTVLVPASIAPIVAGMAPEAMVHAAETTADGRMLASALPARRAVLPVPDAVLVGPGFTPHEETRQVVRDLLAEPGAPLVVDADALNVCAGSCDALQAAARELVLTPHPGEAARLLEASVADIQSDREHFARALQTRTGATTVLKGAGSLVVAAGRPCRVNLTGNPGMATGGTGDVLAGLLTGLIGQGINPFDAASIAVYVHGSAGDEAAWSGSQAGLKASDIIRALPMAFRRVVPR